MLLEHILNGLTRRILSGSEDRRGGIIFEGGGQPGRDRWFATANIKRMSGDPFTQQEIEIAAVDQDDAAFERLFEPLWRVAYLKGLPNPPRG
jgi:hypothetical protein